jgi:Ca2+-binding EF-hand superfamily protein
VVEGSADIYMALTLTLTLTLTVFDAYDDRSDGTIDIQHLGIVLRASGLIVTNQDIKDIAEDADPSSTGIIDLGQFFVVVARYKTTRV